MHLYSTRRALYLCAAAALLLALGVARASPACVAYGSALIAGVAVSRALTLLSVARARAAGFEMSWLSDRRAQRATRLHPLTITAELRNRDSSPMRFRDLCVEHSPHLTVTATPRSGSIPPHGRLSIELAVTPLRVGYQGIFGVVLETLRAPGLHTVPLGFNNPLVLEVLPRGAEITIPGAFARKRGEMDPNARTSARSGDGAEFRELREHRPGDPFKRIAWKASARRGRLLTVEKSVEEHARIWIVVDASVDAWTGPSGRAPCDRAIDDAAALGRAHLSAGDAIGLALVGARHTVGLPLWHGPKQEGQLLSALAFSMHTAHADRSGWAEEEVLARALEHARSLSPDQFVSRDGAGPDSISVLSKLVEGAPVLAGEPFGVSASDRLARRYLLSFGIQPPVRGISDRSAVEARIAEELHALARERPRPTAVYLLGQPPTLETPRQLLEALGHLRRRRIEVRFLPEVPSLDGALVTDSPQRELTYAALSARLRLSSELGQRTLMSLGVRIVPRRSRHQGLRTSIARSMTS
jgi:uncharacterized protein (DUF58 family)